MPDSQKNVADPSATSPGAILKRCREYHDLTLEEAEESTKIGANYLAALEDDQISQFSSLAYLKGFLRIYATYLGLNPDDMIRLYEKLYSGGNGKTDNNRSGSPAAGPPPPRKKFPLQKLAMPAVILVLILITSTIINRSPSTPVRQDQPVSPPAATVPVQPAHSSAMRAGRAEKPGDPVVEQKQGDSRPTTHNGAQKNPAESTKDFVVRLKVLQSGTLTVTIDGSASQAYDLAVGDSIEWKAERNISIELSNAGGVEAELNGRLLKPFGQSGKPATVVLDSQGIRQ